MRSRLLGSFLAVLCFGGGLLYAAGDDLGAFLDRGRALSKAGKYEQALPYFLLALERGEARYGRDSADLVPFLDALAELYANRENYGDAEPLYERALEIQERALASFQAGIARTQNKLASIYEATGRSAEAEGLYRRVLTVSQAALGAEHPSVQVARRRLAGIVAARLPKPPPKEIARPPPSAPAYRIHLTSVRKQADVPGEWVRLNRVYGELIAGLELTVTRADLGPRRGVWYRVQGGPLSESAAKARCGAFAKRGVWCRVVRPLAPPAPAKPAVAVKRPKEAVPPAPGFRIHLTSIRNPAKAEQEWARLRRLYRDLLKGLELAVVRADLGAKRGVWYRIQGGPLSQDAARALCAAFAERNVWCRVAGPRGDAADWMQRQVAQRARCRAAPTTCGTRRPRPGWRLGRRRLARRRFVTAPGCRRVPQRY